MSFIFGKEGPPAIKQIDPSEDARQLRRRIAMRGGEQSTILTGLLAEQSGGRGNVFKRSLGGAER